MAGKLFVVLFAFLAVQGWTSAGVVSDDAFDLIEAVIGNADLAGLGDLREENADELVPEPHMEDPVQCLPYMTDAWKSVMTARLMIKKAKQLVQKLHEGAITCKTSYLYIGNAEKKKQCYDNLKRLAIYEGKPLRDAYKNDLRAKIIDHMSKFDRCLH